MSALIMLIPVSLVLLSIAVWAFFWAVNRGQFDDLDTPPLRILEDDPPRAIEENRSESECRDNIEPSPQPHSRRKRGSGT